MQKKILGIFFTVLFIGIVSMLYSLYSYTDENIVEIREYPSPLKKEQKTEKFKKSWIEGLAKSKKQTYSFPVNDMYMQIDLYKYIPPKTKAYRLIIDRVDRYSIFCVLQTLSAFKLPFVFSKEGKNSTIYIGSPSSKPLEKIVKRLKEYDIKSKIVEIWL